MMREMIHKPHHKRHHRFSERTQVYILTGFAVVMVLALLGLILWWMNKP
jgi:hypothetical protein